MTPDVWRDDPLDGLPPAVQRLATFVVEDMESILVYAAQARTDAAEYEASGDRVSAAALRALAGLVEEHLQVRCPDADDIVTAVRAAVVRAEADLPDDPT